jgi:outer membrane protein assembly factor BamB
LRTLWTLALNNALTAPPAFSGTHGYFPIEGGRLVAYDLVSGSQLWMVSSSTRAEPVPGDGLLFLVEPNEISALRESDGGAAWRLPYAGPPLATPLVWDNGWLITADTVGAVTAFRAVDGHEIWRRNTGSEVHAPPALAADRVYIPTADGRLIALRVDTGDPVWEHRLGGAPNDVLALDDRIYVGSNDNFFYCLDTAKGEIIWRWQTGGDVIGRPALDDKRVYFVSLDNLLRGLDRKSGAQLWKRALPMRPTTGPLLAGNTLIVTGLEPAPRAYLAKDGSPGSDLQVSGVVAAPPRIVTVPIGLPLLIFVTSNIANGVTVTAMTRSMDPPVIPVLAPLPNLVTVPVPASPTVPSPLVSNPSIQPG